MLQLARQWVAPFASPRQLASILKVSRLLTGWGAREAQGTPAPSVVRRRDRRGDALDLHDFHQSAWVGRLVAKSRPSMHADIGSRVTIVGVLSGFMPVIYITRRPLHAHVAGLLPVTGDLTQVPLPDKSVVSLSSLCAVGLDGDAAGAVKALGELQRVLGYRGSLYLSVPVGRERTGPDGQRIFAPDTVLAAVPFLRLRRFNYVDDGGEFHAAAPLEEAVRLDCGRGLFEFERG